VIALAVLVGILGHPGAKAIGPLPKELQVPLPYFACSARPLRTRLPLRLLAGAWHARGEGGLCQGRVRGEAVDAAGGTSAVDAVSAAKLAMSSAATRM